MAGRFLEDSSAYCLRAAATSAGCTSCPVALDQWFFVYVTTAASSVSFIACHDGMPLSVPLSTIASCLFLSASCTIGEPSNGLTGPPPLPLAWWHCAQVAL